MLLDYALNELLERHGFDTRTPEGRHRRDAIMFIGTLPMPFEGKKHLSEWVLGERFLD